MFFLGEIVIVLTKFPEVLEIKTSFKISAHQIQNKTQTVIFPQEQAPSIPPITSG